MASKINISSLVNGLNQVIKAAEEIAPVAQALGGPVVANAATIVIASMAVAQNVLERASELKGALSEQDETKLRAMLSDLQQVNDRLAGAIAEEAEAEASAGPGTGSEEAGGGS